ncbi:MAG: hypothetical protein IJA23_03435 [Clostridia bacterium]|nr:hypothetical protein [Clostridia bacterium]
MVKKSQTASVEELTQKEISALEANDKLSKLEKASARDKKVIAEYKEREKASARALVLFERKLKYLKTTMIEDLLKLCSVIDDTKAQYEDRCSKVYNAEMKSELLEYKDNYTLFANEIYNICNKIEAGASISNEDRAFISNKQVSTSTASGDTKSRFDKLKEQFNQKIGASVMRKPGRPRKEDQSVVSDIGLGKKVEKKIQETDDTKNRLNDIFYNAPTSTSKTVVSNIPETSDSVFDFNEALNPNISLKDIMSDIMAEKPEEEVKQYSAESQKASEIQKAESQSKIELLESGFIRTPMVKRGIVKTDKLVAEEKKPKPTFEKRFFSIQNITKIGE